MTVRWLIRDDLPRILAIERACFEYPWDEDDFYRVLAQRNCLGFVVEDSLPDGSQPVAGFMIIELLKSRLHILNIAVDPASHRQGFGTQLIDKAKRMLSLRRDVIRLEVRERNLPAQLFFRAMGFGAVGVCQDFYLDSDEDAYLFCFAKEVST